MRRSSDPHSRALHSALVPADAHDLNARLRRLNIETLEYSPDHDHADLWRALRLAYEERSRRLPEGAPEAEVFSKATTPPIQRFMAFAYSQMQVSASNKPVLPIVQDGIVCSLLEGTSDGTMKISELADELRRTLRISAEEALGVTAESIKRLAARDQLLNDEETVMLSERPPNLLEAHLRDLSISVMDRMRVREQVRVTDNDQHAAMTVLENVFMSRAWDLAAHYAGAAAGWGNDLRAVVRRLVSVESRVRSISAPGAMERAVIDLFNAPEDREAPLLAALGRAAFGLQLILSSPRQALFQKYALPDRVYLDSNVLMPAITEGHPLRPVYIDSIRRLGEASKEAGAPLTVAVGTQFLNEIVSHRRLAIDLVRNNDLENTEKLSQHIGFYSAANTNVFIGAYASFVGRTKQRVKFAEFLARVAPYDDEDALATHLANLGIRAQTMDFREEHNAQFVAVFSRLRQSYEDLKDSMLRGKEVILIEHEAQQLTQLVLDGNAGLRSLLVTADRQLRRALDRETSLHHLNGMTVSQLGLVAIVDVLVGLETDTRSLARLLWAAPYSEAEEAVFDYFVHLALRNYEEGMAMEMQEAAKRITAEAMRTARMERVPLFGKSTDDVATTAKFLDRFEDRFFQYWREAIDKRTA